MALRRDRGPGRLCSPDHIDGADLTRSGADRARAGTSSQLARHVDGGQRWAREIVATRAEAPPPDTALRDLSASPTRIRRGLAPSLTEAAARAAPPRCARPARTRRCGARCPAAAARLLRASVRPRDRDAPRRRGAGARHRLRRAEPSSPSTASRSGWNSVVCPSISRSTRGCASCSGPAHHRAARHRHRRRLAARLHRRRDRVATRRRSRRRRAPGPVTDLLLVLYRRLPVTAVEIGRATPRWSTSGWSGSRSAELSRSSRRSTSSRHAHDAVIGTSARAAASSSCLPMITASASRPSRVRHSW